jgi:hypothetical protein
MAKIKSFLLLITASITLTTPVYAYCQCETQPASLDWARIEKYVFSVYEYEIYEYSAMVRTLQYLTGLTITGIYEPETHEARLVKAKERNLKAPVFYDIVLGESA